MADEGNVTPRGGHPPALSRVKEMVVTRRGGGMTFRIIIISVYRITVHTDFCFISII